MAKRRKSAKRARRPVVKTIRGVGKRCVSINRKGQWRFEKNSACGLSKKR